MSESAWAGGLREKGSLTAFTAVFVVAMIAVCGLVVDGGRYLAAEQAATAEAEQSARAGAAALDIGSLRAGVVAADPAAAVAAAESAMAAEGHPGVATVDGATVTASVDPFEMRTALLSIVGIDQFTVSATAEATSVHGVSSED